MAKRLIDADKLMEKAQRFEYQCDDEGTLFDSFQYIDPEDVEKAPTVDAVELPCNIGDAVYVVYSPKYPANPSDKGKWFMWEDGVQRILLGAKGLSIETWNMGTIPANKIGKTLFFNKEEAEAALKERKENE